MGKIVCEHGKLIFDKLKVNEREWCKTATEGFAMPERERIEIETDGKNEQHMGVLKAFTDRILDGAPLVAEGREGIRGLTLSNAMFLSSWMDRTVTLPEGSKASGNEISFDEEIFLEELNKRRKLSKKKEDKGITFSTEGTY